LYRPRKKKLPCSFLLALHAHTRTRFSSRRLIEAPRTRAHNGVKKALEVLVPPPPLHPHPRSTLLEPSGKTPPRREKQGRSGQRREGERAGGRERERQRGADYNVAVIRISRLTRERLRATAVARTHARTRPRRRHEKLARLMGKLWRARMARLFPWELDVRSRN
jgi:hypothetical protein